MLVKSLAHALETQRCCPLEQTLALSGKDKLSTSSASEAENGLRNLTSRSHETVAGTLAGIAGKIVEHPLDTVKTRLQESGSRFSNPMHCFDCMLREEGATSFFRGISAPIVASALEHAFTFVAFSESLAFVDRALYGDQTNGTSSVVGSTQHRAELSLSTHAVAGGLSGMISTSVITPLEFLKCRMQQCTSRRRLTLREIVRDGGWKRVFDGQSATLAREIPGTAAWFIFYELSLRRLKRIQGSDELSSVQIACAGGFAGVMYWTTVFPADVVKTRMQLDPVFCQRGLLCGLRTIVKNEGPRALYRGWSCTVVSAFPGNAAIFLTYEKAMAFLEAKEIQKREQEAENTMNRHWRQEEADASHRGTVALH